MAAMKRNLTVNYQITKLTPIILYGAAAVGRLFYRIFMQMGYNILGFIDKRYDEIHLFQEYYNLNLNPLYSYSPT